MEVMGMVSWDSHHFVDRRALLKTGAREKKVVPRGGATHASQASGMAIISISWNEIACRSLAEWKLDEITHGKFPGSDGYR